MNRIAELRELLAKATKGPWYAIDKNPEADEKFAHEMEFHRDDGDIKREFLIRWRPNANLVVAMRNNYEALLDVAEAANECMAHWEGAACVVTPPCGSCDACHLAIALAKVT